ncbi:MAG: undecaprenyl-diphosphate phosphatase [Planctomycetaceae bacterium]
MDYLEAVLLGVVQGVAEFLPISSSGHLVIVGAVLREWTGREVDPESNLQLNVAVHLGTLFSILLVYRRDLPRVLRDVRLCLFIVLATLPVAVVGLTLQDVLKAHLFTPLAAGVCLFVTAGLLACAERSPGGSSTTGCMTAKQAGTIGLFQALAILPGVSRSGSTISAGLLTGMEPDDAARFSFFIAIPAIAGAVVVTAKDMLTGEGGDTSLPVLLVGAAVAFLVGWLSLRGLLGLVRRRQLRWFAWYCAVAGAATVAWQLAR